MSTTIFNESHVMYAAEAFAANRPEDISDSDTNAYCFNSDFRKLVDAAVFQILQSRVNIDRKVEPISEANPTVQPAASKLQAYGFDLRGKVARQLNRFGQRLFQALPFGRSVRESSLNSSTAARLA